MTDFDRGSLVTLRDYAAKMHPRYAEQVGEYQGYRSVGRKHLLTVCWEDDSTAEYPASYLKQARGANADVAARRIAENRSRALNDDNDHHLPAPTGDVIPPAGFKPPELFSDDVRAGRVVIETNEVRDEPPAPVEPTYGACNGYRCGCDDWNPGRKVGGLQVCATCTHTQNTHKVPTQARVIKRGVV